MGVNSPSYRGRIGRIWRWPQMEMELNLDWPGAVSGHWPDRGLIPGRKILLRKCALFKSVGRIEAV